MVKGDLTDEEYREYDFGTRVYRILSPLTLYISNGGTTHRILDSEGVVHCAPAPGYFNCVLRWKPKEGKDPVAF